MARHRNYHPVDQTVPEEAHRIVIFLAAALHKHTIIFTKANYRTIEQWIELVIRLFLYDRTKLQRKRTVDLLKRDAPAILQNIRSIFNFERILVESQDDVMKREEKEVMRVWTQLIHRIDGAVTTLNSHSHGGHPNKKKRKSETLGDSPCQRRSSSSAKTHNMPKKTTNRRRKKDMQNSNRAMSRTTPARKRRQKRPGG